MHISRTARKCGQSRVESAVSIESRITETLTEWQQHEWRRSRTINESWSNKKGGMVETQGIDSFRVVTSKIIRCHRWIIFLDWRMQFDNFDAGDAIGMILWARWFWFLLCWRMRSMLYVCWDQCWYGADTYLPQAKGRYLSAPGKRQILICLLVSEKLSPTTVRKALPTCPPPSERLRSSWTPTHQWVFAKTILIHSLIHSTDNCISFRHIGSDSTSWRKTAISCCNSYSDWI